jgi:hypothetical protein
MASARTQQRIPPPIVPLSLPVYLLTVVTFALEACLQSLCLETDIFSGSAIQAFTRHVTIYLQFQGTYMYGNVFFPYYDGTQVCLLLNSKYI